MSASDWRPHAAAPVRPEGYIIVSALMRLKEDRGMNVKRAIERFALARPPGIYKVWMPERPLVHVSSRALLQC